MLRVYQIKWACNNPTIIQCVFPTSIQIHDKEYENMSAQEIKENIHDFLVETYEYEPLKFKYRILKDKKPKIQKSY